MPGITHEIEYIGGGPTETTRSSWMWIGAGALAVVLVMFMQWFQGDTRSQTTETAPISLRQSETVEWGGYSPFALEAKQAIKLGQSKEGRDLDEDDPESPTTGMEKLQMRIEPLAVTRAERLRAAIVAGELVGKDEALSRLAALAPELEPGSALASDAEWLRRIYTDGPDSVPKEAQEALLDRHEWFGRLALTFGKPMSDAMRRQAVGGWKRIQLSYMRVFGLYFIMVVGGIGLLIWAGWLIGGGTIAFDNAPGGNPDQYLQTFVLFCGAFVIVCGLALVPFAMAAEGSIGAQVFHDILSWTLPLVLIWPLSRGVKWSTFRNDVGWTTGKGVIKEVLVGAAAQVAWTPLLLIVAISLGLIEGMFSSGDEGVGGYPMFQHPPAEHPVVRFIMVTSTVIWAPVVEETMFRGLLYGWIRQRLGFRPTLLLTSAIFGMIHPYSPLGMVQVAFGGLLFGMLREWRGSLIAPMVAHAINNGVIVFVSYSISNAIGA